MISSESKRFLLQSIQLQENFARLSTINNLLKEAKIDLSDLDKRLDGYDKFFIEMMNNSPINQDWNFIIRQLEDNRKELSTYFTWIKDVENYDIQITKPELQRMIRYRSTIESQIQALNALLGA